MMICCLNPDCPNPLNYQGKKLCQACTSPLVPLLRNRLRVIKVLSDEGGFGKTYLAEDIDKLNERCVIKQLAPKFQGSWSLRKAMELFQKEATRLQQLGEHPQIPTLLAYFEHDSYLYLVQQFIDGQNLLKELQQRAYNSSDIQQVLLDLLPVLQFIHERGVIHRDIKPQNIIRGQNGRLTLIDFGSSKQLNAKVQMKMGTAIGSHGYAPIEQIRDGAAYPASDLFSLGATCFHLLTKVSPFQLWMEDGYGWVSNWQQYLKSPISNDLAQVLDKLLQKEIKQRYQSANDVIKDLTPKPQLLLPPAAPSPQASLIVPPTQPPLPTHYGSIRNLLLVSAAVTLLGLGEFWYTQYRHIESVSPTLSQSNTPANKEPLLSQSPKTALENFALANTLKGHTNSVVSVAITPDGKTIVSNSGDSIKLWNLATGEEISTFNGHSHRVNVLAISPDGQTLVSGSEDNTIKLWNLANGQEIETLKGHSNSIHALAFSPDGSLIADGSDDNTIKVWNRATAEEIRTLRGHSSEVRSIAISPDGEILASGSLDKTIKLWNLETGKLIRTLRKHSGKVTSLVMGPDGKILVSGSEDNTIKVWDLQTRKLIRTLTGHTNSVTSLSISADGKILASGSLDKTIKLWDVSSGKEIRTLAGHGDGVQSVALSVDGVNLVSGSEDNTIKIWRVSR